MTLSPALQDVLEYLELHDLKIIKRDENTIWLTSDESLTPVRTKTLEPAIAAKIDIATSTLEMTSASSYSPARFVLRIDENALEHVHNALHDIEQFILETEKFQEGLL